MLPEASPHPAQRDGGASVRLTAPPATRLETGLARPLPINPPPPECETPGFVRSHETGYLTNPHPRHKRRNTQAHCRWTITDSVRVLPVGQVCLLVQHAARHSMQGLCLIRPAGPFCFRTNQPEIGFARQNQCNFNRLGIKMQAAGFNVNKIGHGYRKNMNSSGAKIFLFKKIGAPTSPSQNRANSGASTEKDPLTGGTFLHQ